MEIKKEGQLQIIRQQVNPLWMLTDSIWKLDESVTDPSFRIALSLLRSHPECKSQADVVNETSIPQKTVSNHLSGKVDSTRQYFHRCDKGHRLSDEGLQWVFDKIAPSLSSPSNETQSEGV